MRKHIFSILLCLSMMLILLPFTALADTTSVNIGTTTLTDGKYYTVKTDGDPKLVDELDDQPTDDTPYLYYNDGVLIVSGDVSFTSDGPSPLVISGGNMEISGSGSLELSSSVSPPVQLNGKVLSLDGSVDFTAEQTGTSSIPAIYSGALQTADDYSGDIIIDSDRGNALIEMSAVNIQTSGDISISGGNSPTIGSSNDVTLKGSVVALKSKTNGMLITTMNQADISITATDDSLYFLGNVDSPLLSCGQGGVTLSADGDITIENSGTGSNGIAVAGNLTVTKADNVNIIGNGGQAVIGEADITAAGDVIITSQGNFAANALNVSGARNVTVTSNGNTPTIVNSVDISVSGDVKLENKGSLGVMTCGSYAKIITSDGSISVSGKGTTSVIKVSGDVTLSAKNDILVQRTDDDGAKDPLVSCGSKTVSSESGVVTFSSDELGTTITLPGGSPISAVYGGDKSSGLNLANSTPTENTYYKAEDGYLLFTPMNNNDPATLTLHDATISSTGGDAALVLGSNYVVKLEGNNTITHKTRAIFCNGGALTVEGPGSLHTSGSVGLSAAEITIKNNAILDISYPNGQSGINSSAGDVVIQDSTVTVKSDNSGSGIGSGAILANDNQGINGWNSNVIITNSKVIAIDTTANAINASFGGVTLTNSNVVAIGKDDFFGAIYNDYGEGHYATVDGGTLYVKNTGSGYDTTYSSHDTAVNGAVIYCGGQYSSLFGGNGKNAQFSNCHYDEDKDKVSIVGAGRLYGDWTYSEDLPLPDTAKVTLKSPGTLTIPLGVTADIPNILQIDSGATLQNNGTLNISGGEILYGVNGGSGTLNGIVMTASDTTYTYTVSGDADYTDFVYVGIISVNTKETQNKLVVPENTTLTIDNGVIFDLTINGITADNLTDYFSVNGRVVNNGTMKLPQGTTAQKIQELHLTGTGLVKVGDTTYTNDGTMLIVVSGGLTLSTIEVPATDNAGYTWIKSGEGEDTVWTLTLTNNTYIDGNVILPDEHVVFNTMEDSYIIGTITLGMNDPCDLSFIGSGSLTIGDSIIDTQGGTITVSGGGNVTVSGEVNIGDNGGEDSTLNVIGAGTILDISSADDCAAFFTTVNVESGATLNASAEGKDSIGVEALEGGVNVTDGSTLTVGCDYGVYVIDGKLIVDSTSKLTTNGSVAPFCIVADSSKSQSNVISLPGIPDGTEINFVEGTDVKYWSLVQKNDNLNVTNETSTPVTMTGAASGLLTFIKSASTGGSNGGSGSSLYVLTFDTNGGSKISKEYKKYGTVIKLSEYQPTRDGYDFDGWYSDEKLTNSVSSVKLTGNVTVYAKWTEKTAVTTDTTNTSNNSNTTNTANTANTANPFIDVANTDYFHDAVLWAVEKGITSGTSSNLFSPNMVCTRAQTVTLLWKAMGSPEPTSTDCIFTDVAKDAYYYKAVLWAVENGIAAGTSSTTFSPDSTVTRAQAVTFMWRAEGKPVVNCANPFTDVTGNDYYYDAIMWAVEKNITQGSGTSTFSPNNFCTRGQIVSFLYREKL